ncbi:MAG: glycosyltransferase family 4 protein [Pirellulales bacterium]
MNLHAMVAAGLPEMKLHTLISHGAADFDWKVDLPDEIHTRCFGAGESPFDRSLSRLIPEWQKGGEIIRYLHENDIRAVIITGYYYASYVRIINHCHRVGIPLFGHNDSNIENERNLGRWKRWLKTRVYRWWIPRTTGIMSMGRLGDQFFQQYGAVPERIYRVPCYPDLDLFERGDANRLSDFRREYGLRDGRRYLIYSGRLVSQKRVDLLIDAFVAIAAQRPEWDLLIVGEGRLGDELRRRIPEQFQSRVIWTGFQELEGCVAAYHAAEVLVLPSDFEPWAVVVQEAMAAGLVVIASDVVGAACELVQDGDSGRIFPAGNKAKLAEAILDVTAVGALAKYRLRARQSLQDWRSQVIPATEIRRALTDCKVLPLSGT